jgi:hypothetical protein
VALSVPRNIPVQAGRWIWITTGIVLLAIALLLIVMSGNEPMPDYGSHLFWFW